MVFFTCNGCGESLKKAQVDKHVNICRGCQVLSCIDCGKDFWGNDYMNHNKCISEDQKYGGKGFEAKANKGDVKQQQWIQKVHEAMDKPGVSAKLKDVLKQVSTYDNVPRKKAKFQNWMRNSLKIGNTSLHDEVWDILMAADKVSYSETKEAEQTVAEVNTNGKQSDNTDVKKKPNKRERKKERQQKNGKSVKGANMAVVQESEEHLLGKKKKKGKKRQHSCEEDENDGQTGNETSSNKKKKSKAISINTMWNGKFNWKGNIKAVLRASPDQELPVKKLRKKVLAAYYSFAGDGNFKTEEQLLALFNKKINNNPKFRVMKERVHLLK
uniref:Cell growth-regulating nucleolar protein n=1 Tax=Mola mola TaxID=94237 RepID=A0A3Q3WNE5_MOLML